MNIHNMSGPVFSDAEIDTFPPTLKVPVQTAMTLQVEKSAPVGGCLGCLILYMTSIYIDPLRSMGRLSIYLRKNG